MFICGWSTCCTFCVKISVQVGFQMLSEIFESETLHDNTFLVISGLACSYEVWWPWIISRSHEFLKMKKEDFFYIYLFWMWLLWAHELEMIDIGPGIKMTTMAKCPLYNIFFSREHAFTCGLYCWSFIFVIH